MSELYSLGMDYMNLAFDDSFSNIEIFLLTYAMVLFFFWYKKNENMKNIFFYPAVFMLFTIFNPYIMLPISKIIGLSSRIRRLYWLLPVNLVIACTLTLLIISIHKKSKRIFLIIAAIFLIGACGEGMLQNMHKPENIYKITNESIAIADIIAQDADTEEPKKCLYADLPLLELRQYDPSIHNALQRKDLLNWNIDPNNADAVSETLNKSKRRTLALVLRYGLQVSPSAFSEAAARYNVSYIIPQKSLGLDSYFESMGYTLIGETENYSIYLIE